MVYQITKIDHPRLEEVYERSMQELGDFFELNWVQNRPHLMIVPDRATIDSLMGEKTEDWVVGGWSSNGGVYILSDANFESESSHVYSDAEYFALIKHELAHCFTNVVSGSAKLPVWLSEGISIFVSGQNEFKKRPEKLANFLEFHENGGSGVYSEAGFAVEFLVKTHGRGKLLELIKKIKTTDSRDSFYRLFASIYGFELSYDNFLVS